MPAETIKISGSFKLPDTQAPSARVRRGRFPACIALWDLFALKDVVLCTMLQGLPSGDLLPLNRIRSSVSGMASAGFFGRQMLEVGQLSRDDIARSRMLSALHPPRVVRLLVRPGFGETSVLQNQSSACPHAAFVCCLAHSERDLFPSRHFPRPAGCTLQIA